MRRTVGGWLGGFAAKTDGILAVEPSKLVGNLLLESSNKWKTVRELHESQANRKRILLEWKELYEDLAKYFPEKTTPSFCKLGNPTRMLNLDEFKSSLDGVLRIRRQ